MIKINELENQTCIYRHTYIKKGVWIGLCKHWQTEKPKLIMICTFLGKVKTR